MDDEPKKKVPWARYLHLKPVLVGPKRDPDAVKLLTAPLLDLEKEGLTIGSPFDHPFGVPQRVDKP